MTPYYRTTLHPRTWHNLPLLRCITTFLSGMRPHGLSVRSIQPRRQGQSAEDGVPDTSQQLRCGRVRPLPILLWLSLMVVGAFQADAQHSDRGGYTSNSGETEAGLLTGDEVDCLDFEDGDVSNWYGINLNGIDAVTETGFGKILQLADGTGGSWGINNADFSGNWLERGESGCLCFDYKVEVNEVSGSISDAAPKLIIYTGPAATSTNDVNNALRAVLTGDPANPDIRNNRWDHFCLPIGLCTDGNIPSNALGTWRLFNGSVELTGSDACDAWNQLIRNVTGLGLRTDYNNSPSEIISFDNFCWSCVGLIQGVKFRDINCDGIRSAGEPVMEGWTITASGPDGNFQATTDEAGRYTIIVPVGENDVNYSMSEELRPGWRQCSPLPPDNVVTVGKADRVIMDFGNNWELNGDCLGINSLQVACRSDLSLAQRRYEMLASVANDLECGGNGISINIVSAESNLGPVFVTPAQTLLTGSSGTLLLSLDVPGALSPDNIQIVIEICCDTEDRLYINNCCYDTIDIQLDQEIEDVAIRSDKPTTFCEGDSLVLTASPDGMQYLWSTGARTQSIVVYNAGSYGVVVGSPGLCPTGATIEIATTAPPKAEISASGPAKFCVGDSLILTAQPDGMTYAWSTGESTQSIVVRETGIYEVSVVDSNGCSGLASIETEIFDYPMASITGRDTICRGASFRMTASGGTDYSWSPEAGLGCTRCPTTIARPDTTTTYTVIASNDGGCADTASFTVTVLDAPNVSVSLDGPTTFCEGDSLTLTADVEGANYRWSNDATTRSITVFESGEYSVEADVGAGCAGISESISVTVAPRPTATIVGESSVCNGGSVQLAASGGDAYAWEPTTGLSCPDCPNPVATPKTTTTYRLIVTNAGGCSDTVSHTITVTDALDVKVIPETTPKLCPGDSLTLTAIPAGDTYRWSNGATTESIVVTGPGSYSVAVTDSDGCSGSSNPVTVTFGEAPVAAIEGDTLFCGNDSALLVGSGGVRYEWSPASGVGCVECAVTRVLPDGATTYRLTVFDENGCSDTAEIRVVPDETPEIVRIRISRDAIAGPGSRVLVPILVEGSSADILRGNTGIEIAVGFSGSILSWIGARQNGTRSDGMSFQVLSNDREQTRFRLTGQTSGDSDTLILLEYRTWLGNRESSELPLSVALVPADPCIDVEVLPGLVRLDSICGLEFRLIETTSAGRTRLHDIPDPVGGAAALRFNLALDGHAALEIVDGRGRLVARPVDEYLSSGPHSRTFDISGLPSGVYFCRLVFGDRMEIQKFVLAE